MNEEQKLWAKIYSNYIISSNTLRDYEKITPSSHKKSVWLADSAIKEAKLRFNDEDIAKEIINCFNSELNNLSHSHKEKSVTALVEVSINLSKFSNLPSAESICSNIKIYNKIMHEYQSKFMFKDVNLFSRKESLVMTFYCPYIRGMFFD